MSARRDRLSQHRSAHVGVAARFEQRRPTQVLSVLRRPSFLVFHRRARRRRKSFDDQPHEATFGVSIYRLELKA